MEKVLFAVGNAEYTNILRKYFEQEEDSFKLSEQEIMHRKYLEEIIELEKPDILVIHDYYLSTDLLDLHDRERDWIAFIQKLRVTYDDSIRVVFLCEREKGDPFLHELVSHNVLDIFNERAIQMVELINQLKDKPRFSKVSKFQSTEPAPEPIVTERVEPTQSPAPSEEKLKEEKKEKTKVTKKPPVEKPKKTKEKTEKAVVQKVIEKKVNVVNKQVIKRDYNIQLLNQVEKVVGVPIEKKLIMIGSPFPRSGSTFISHLLAKELADIGISVTYIESPFSAAYSYDRFVGHRLNPTYKSKFYQLTQEQTPTIDSVFDWNVADVNMIVKNPTDEPIYNAEQISFDVFIKTLFATQSTVTIVDVGSELDKEVYRDIFDIATNLYITLEPDISNIQFLEDPDNLVTAYCRELMKNDKTTVIGNRFDKSIMNNDLIKEIYEDKLQTIIPDFPSKDVFESQLKGDFLNLQRQHKDLIQEALEPIIYDLVPKEFLKKYKKQNKFMNGLLNKRIKIEKT